MYEENKQIIIRCWNNTSKEEKKVLMSRFIADHPEDYSINAWLEFIYRELDVAQIAEGNCHHGGFAITRQHAEVSGKGAPAEQTAR